MQAKNCFFKIEAVSAFQSTILAFWSLVLVFSLAFLIGFNPSLSFASTESDQLLRLDDRQVWLCNRIGYDSNCKIPFLDLEGVSSADEARERIRIYDRQNYSDYLSYEPFMAYTELSSDIHKRVRAMDVTIDGHTISLHMLMARWVVLGHPLPPEVTESFSLNLDSQNFSMQEDDFFTTYSDSSSRYVVEVRKLTCEKTGELNGVVFRIMSSDWYARFGATAANYLVFKNTQEGFVEVYRGNVKSFEELRQERLSKARDRRQQERERALSKIRP